MSGSFLSVAATPRRALAVGLALAAASAAAPSAAARDVPPPPASYVLDETDWLVAAEEARLSETLLRYERETSNQIAVAVFHSLEGEDLAEFSHRVATAWRIGRADRDNGILLAIYVEDRKIDIEVGYGLEGAVPDAVADRIRRTVLVPALREGRRAEGISDTVDALIAASRGEYEGDGRAQSDRIPGRAKLFLVLAIVAIVLFVAWANRSSGPMVLGPPHWGRSGRLTRSLARAILAGGLGGGFRGGGGGFRGGGGSFGGGGARGSW